MIRLKTLSSRGKILAILILALLAIVILYIVGSSRELSPSSSEDSFKTVQQGDFTIELPNSFSEVDSAEIIGARYVSRYGTDNKLLATISVERFSESNQGDFTSQIKSIHQNHRQLNKDLVGDVAILGFSVADSEYYYFSTSSQIWRIHIVADVNTVSKSDKDRILRSFKIEDIPSYEE